MPYIVYQNVVNSKDETEEIYYCGTNGVGTDLFTEESSVATKFGSKKLANKAIRQIKKNSNVPVYIKEV